MSEPRDPKDDSVLLGGESENSLTLLRVTREGIDEVVVTEAPRRAKVSLDFVAAAQKEGVTIGRTQLTFHARNGRFTYAILSFDNTDGTLVCELRCWEPA